jgi:hypothetical protein
VRSSRKKVVSRSELDRIASSLPSFQIKWNELLNGDVDQRLLGVEFSFLLTNHLMERAEVEDFTEFAPLFDALEDPLSDRSTELFDSMTMGFLEDLIHACQDRNIDLKRIQKCIKGERVLEEWNAACAYTGRK